MPVANLWEQEASCLPLFVSEGGALKSETESKLFHQDKLLPLVTLTA